MHSLRTKLLTTLVGVVCLGVAFLTATPAHVASVHTTLLHKASSQARSLTSGGGCWTSGDGRVEACISIDRNGIVLPDSYINGPCAYSVVVELVDDSTNLGTIINDGGGCGHFLGIGEFLTSGDVYHAYVVACFSDRSCEGQTSPYQYA